MSKNECFLILDQELWPFIGLDHLNLTVLRIILVCFASSEPESVFNPDKLNLQSFQQQSKLAVNCSHLMKPVRRLHSKAAYLYLHCISLI